MTIKRLEDFKHWSHSANVEVLYFKAPKFTGVLALAGTMDHWAR